MGRIKQAIILEENNKQKQNSIFCASLFFARTNHPFSIFFYLVVEPPI